MKKNNFFLFVLLFSLVACSSGTSVRQIDTYYLTEQSSRLSKIDVSIDKSPIETTYNVITSIIDNTVLYLPSLFVKNVETYYSYYYDVAKKTNVANMRKYADTNTETLNVYNNLYDLLMTMYNNIINIEKKVYKSQYQKNYYGEMTDEEIEKRLASYNFDDTVQKYKKQIKDIEERATKVEQDKSLTDDEHISKSVDLMLEYIPIANGLATYLGYEDYFDYCFKEVYSRDYSPTKADDFVNLLKKEFFPYLKTKSKKTAPNPDLLAKIGSCNFMYKGLKCHDAFYSYSKLMGNEYFDTYNHLLNDGLYYFSANDTSTGTAFVNSIPLDYSKSEPGLYMSKDYQNIDTFAHEFGHYLNAYIGDRNFSYDICETHSQSNELMFMSYQADYLKNNFDYETYATFDYNTAYNTMITSARGAYVWEVESYCFKNSTLSKNDLIAGINDIYKDYSSFLRRTYWCYGALLSSGYYISYAVSAIGSLNLYLSSKKDFSATKDNYLKLVKYDKEDRSIETVYANSNILSPFSKASIDYIKNNFN